MTDIIHLLSDAIANQIAAGEVIQRPASVVKELMENSLDAGAKNIQLVVKDAGRTLIQVIDDGKGMSETDARMAFERHATSKIRNADDLFALHTMGFRGEALASIAAVAQVEMRTARPDDPTGTRLCISGSTVELQESTACTPGTVISVKNLFFNVPARRKFLKSNETEFRNIIIEFERIALVNPDISFILIHNDTEVFNLPPANYKQRIINVFGKRLNPQLISVQAETSLVNISGFIGTPDSSRKSSSLQFFFANNRYMRHPYFHRAVMKAFEPFISAGEAPNYFLYLTVDPASIDVNIHPTKTEIKFENEQAIWMMLSAAVKEAIGKTSALPTLEFDRAEAIEMPVYNPKLTPTERPAINLNPTYNPFQNRQNFDSKPSTLNNWEKMYAENEEPASNPLSLKQETSSEEKKEYLNYHDRYIVTSIKSGICIIDKRRAHIRVLFDEFLQRISQKQGISQGVLFPEIIYFTLEEATVIPFVIDDLTSIGFDLADLGNNSFSICGVPAGSEGIDAVEALHEMVNRVIETGCEAVEEISEALALALARKSAFATGKNLTEEETTSLVARLFASPSPNYTPDGKPVIHLISIEELEKRFK